MAYTSLPNTTIHPELWSWATDDVIDPVAPSAEPGITTYWQWKARMKLLQIGPPVLLITGTFGNVLTLIVLHTKPFRSAPSSLILNALALADLGILITGLTQLWVITLTNYDYRNLTAYGCQVWTFAIYFLRHLSPAYLCLLTVERTIAVYMPLKSKQICSRKRMFISIVILTIILVIINIYHILSSIRLKYEYTNDRNETEVSYQCRRKVKFRNTFYTNFITYLDATLESFIPFLIIAIGNILIIHKLAMANKERKHNMKVTAGGDDKVKSATVMLVVVSICFLLLTLPFCIFHISYRGRAFPVSTNNERARMELANVSNIMLFYLNSTINFYLYCLSGSKFRNALTDLFGCHRVTGDKRQTKSQSESQQTGNKSGITEMSEM